MYPDGDGVALGDATLERPLNAIKEKPKELVGQETLSLVKTGTINPSTF